MLKLYDNFILHAAETTSYWDGQAKAADTDTFAVDPTSELEYNTVQVVFDRTSPSPLVDDIMLFDLAVAKVFLTQGTGHLDSAELDAVESALDTWWGTWKAQVPSTITLKEYRWHQWNAASTRPGPAVRVTPKNVVATGSGTTRLPDQVAHTVTFRTPSRRHWGRVYTPALIPGALSAYGRLTDAQTDSRGANWETLLEAIDTIDIAGDGVTPVVFSRVGKALLSINEIAMDSTCDVIRSRRAKHPSKFFVATS